MFPKCVPLSLCVLAIATSAVHATPLHQRKHSTLRIETPKAQARTSRGKDKRASDAGPALTADTLLKIQTKVTHIRESQIRQYEQLVAATKADSSELADYLFRLAELHAKKERYWRILAMELHPKIDASEGLAKNKLRKEQARQFHKSKKASTKALSVYAQLANTPAHRDFARMHEALFHYAQALHHDKQVTAGLKVVHRLIKEHPDSHYVPHAYLKLADYFFSKDDLERAEEFYQKVLKFPSSSIYSYALYKQGWVHLNQQRHVLALQAFFQVAGHTKGTQRYRALYRAAKNDFVRAYAEVGKVKLAYASFQRVDAKTAQTMLKKLAQLYMEQGKARKAITTYRKLLQVHAHSPRTCEWHEGILAATSSLGNRKDIASELLALIGAYQALRTSKRASKATIQVCQRSAQRATSNATRVWHQEAFKTRNSGDLALIETLYANYVKAFPRAPDIAEMYFYYADLLWYQAEQEANPGRGSQRWQRSAKLFAKVAGNAPKDRQRAKEAAAARVQAWKNAIALAPAQSSPSVDATMAVPEKVHPTPLSTQEKQLLAAFRSYAPYATQDEAAEMKFYRGRIHWKHDQLDTALTLLRQLLAKHPRHQTATYATNILLDTLIRLRRYEEMNELVVHLLAKDTPSSADEEKRSRLHKLRVHYLRDQATLLGKQERHLECGRAFVAIYQGYPQEAGMDDVLYNAGVCFEEGKAIGLALQMYAKLDEKFPDSLRNKRAILRRAGAYEAIANYQQAAQHYEDFARRFPGEDQAPTALQNAVTYRLGLGDDAKAIRNIEDFVRQYRRKHPTEAGDALFGLASIYRKQGSLRKEAKAYQRFIQLVGDSGQRDRLLIANARLGEITWQQSCPHSENGACIKTTRSAASYTGSRQLRVHGLPTQCGPLSKLKTKRMPRIASKAREAYRYFTKAIALGRQGAADDAPSAQRRSAAVYWLLASRFHLLGQEYEEYVDMIFPSGLVFSSKSEKQQAQSGLRFKKWLMEKQTLAVQLNTAYSEIKAQAGSGAAWAVAAAARIGQVSQHFSDQLFTAQIPRTVRNGPFAQEAVDVYCDALTTAAQPLEQASVDAFGFCLAVSSKLNWFNDWSRLCERELGQIRPEEYPTASEIHGDVKAIASIVDTHGLITALARSTIVSSAAR